MKKILCIVVLSTYLILMLSTTVFGATPKLVNKLNSAFEDIESWIINLHTCCSCCSLHWCIDEKIQFWR